MIGPYLTDSTIHKQYKGADKWGEPATTTSITRNCRIDYRNRVAMTISGDEIVSNATILLRPLTVIRSGHASRATGTIAYEDTLTVDNRDCEIIDIRTIKDFSTRYMEVLVR